jgi:hypothetical protein
MAMARLRLGDQSQTVAFEIKPDPRSSATSEDYHEQFRFLIAARDKLTATHCGIKQIRDVRDQLTALDKRLKPRKDAADVLAAARRPAPPPGCSPRTRERLRRRRRAGPG